MRFSVLPAAIVYLVAAHVGAQSAVAPAPTAVAPAPTVERVLTDGSRAPVQAAAQEHFQRALLWYRAGKYRLAIEELDAALDRDPGGKDLVFNLALVQEKLGDLDGAIRSLQRFQSLEKDPREIERANQTLERLEGAQAELAAQEPRHVSELPLAPTPRRRGKLDLWVAGAGGLAVASLLAAVVFAVRTLTLGPRGELVNDDTQGRAERAHHAAVLTDLAVSTSLLFGTEAAALYFGRYSDAPPPHAVLPRPIPRVSAAWLELRY